MTELFGESIFWGGNIVGAFLKVMSQIIKITTLVAIKVKDILCYNAKVVTFLALSPKILLAREVCQGTSSLEKIPKSGAEWFPSVLTKQN